MIWSERGRRIIWLPWLPVCQGGGEARNIPTLGKIMPEFDRSREGKKVVMIFLQKIYNFSS